MLPKRSGASRFTRRPLTLAKKASIGLLFTALGACGSKGSGGPDAGPNGSGNASSGKVLEAADNESSLDTASTARAAESEVVKIPAGKFDSGSTPGDKGRDPSIEPALVPVELGAFDIDRFLYPNDLEKPPMTGVGRERAESLCKERGRRLCTELEWERACKGPGDDLYAGRGGWDPACTKSPSSCSSGFGVVGMGARAEIVTGEISEVKDYVSGGAVSRGAGSGAPSVNRRCAHRGRASDAGGESSFRCCGGAPNAATIGAPEVKQTFTRTQLPAADLAALFHDVKELRKLSGDIKYFDESSAKQVIALSDAGEVPKGVTLTTEPLLWSPVPGEEILLLTGLSGEDSFVLAFHELPGGRHRIGSSLILHRDHGPVAFGFNGYDGRRSRDKPAAIVDWATCWKCAGESGRVTYRDDNRVVITQE